MSKVEELLETYNPNGVEFDEIGKNVQSLPKEILKNEFVQQQGQYPVINSGRDIQGYYSRYNNYGDVFTVASRGESAGFIQYSATPFWAGGLCYPYRTKDNNKVSTKFLYYYLKKTEKSIMTNMVSRGGIPAINKTIFEKYKIPLPHIKVQEEIVKILDSFTNLIDALNEELSLRQKQLEYYRDQLYDDLFKKTKGVDVLCFSELGQIERGKRFVRDDIKSHGQPCIHYGDMYTFYGVKSNKAKTYLDRDFPKKMRYADIGDVIIVGAGENNWDIGVGLAWLGEEPAAVHDACYIVKHNNNPLFIAYYTRTTEYHQQLKKCVSEGKICSFSAEGLGKVTIPIPSLAIQQSIVEKLDAFESLISSLKEEIALRQKQYEYYREKLLTFD